MTHFEYQSTGQLGSHAAIGLIVLSTDETLEYEIYQWLNTPNVTIYTSRIPMAAENTPEALDQMRDHISLSAALLPNRVKYDVLAYGCTSASAVMGHDIVDGLLGAACPAQSFTNPLKALQNHCKIHSISSIDLLTPYSPETTKPLIQAIQNSGVEIGNIGSFDEIDDAQVARISPNSIQEAAMELGKNSHSDAVFISCTNLRTLTIQPSLQSKLGKPVMTSNQLLAWDIARLAGIHCSSNNLMA